MNSDKAALKKPCKKVKKSFKFQFYEANILFILYSHFMWLSSLWHGILIPGFILQPWLNSPKKIFKPVPTKTSNLKKIY